MPDEPSVPAIDRETPPDDTGFPPANDPGGARSRGYSADADPNAPPVPEPIPLADAPRGGIRVPERDNTVTPTGRSEPPDDPNNRVVNSPD